MAFVNLIIITISLTLLSTVCAPPPTRKPPTPPPRSSPPPPQPSPSPPPPPFSYAIVVFQWPMALCATADPHYPCKVSSRPEEFRLHGVWPTNVVGSPATCGTHSPFVYSQVKDIPSINQFWPNYFGLNKDFWKHEWDYHGVCSGQLVSEYFENSLSLFQMKYTRILTSLIQDGIKPTRGTNVRGAPTVEKIYNALRTGLGLVPMLHCTTFQGSVYLLEVRLCANPYLKSFGNCPANYYANCGKKEQNVLFYAE